MFSESVGNILSFWLSFFFAMYLFSISKVVCLSFATRPMVCFAPVKNTVPLLRLTSDTFNHVNSMGLAPVSFSIDRYRLIRARALAIMRSIFCSWGIFGHVL